MLSDHRNSKAQGNVGVGAAIAFATRSGYGVSIPLNDSQEYDLIFDMHDQGYVRSLIKKIQVKTTRYKTPHGVYQCSLATNGGNQTRSTIKKFDRDAIDYLFVLCENGDQYFIPTCLIDNKHTINLGKDWVEFKV